LRAARSPLIQVVGLRRTLWIAAAALLFSIAAPVVSSGQTTVPAQLAFDRVRSSDEALATLIRQATARSATFHAIVQTIESSDGFVYVEPKVCHTGARACLIAVNGAGESRFFRVHVATDRPEWDLIGAIAHELWHVTEVLMVRSVRTNAAMYLLYDRQGLHRSSGFETREAIRAGNQVRREVR
jgi:hypothetical protein